MVASTSPARRAARPSRATTRSRSPSTEAHARGLELHAWFNPYRARIASAKRRAARTHISVTQPGARAARTATTCGWIRASPAVDAQTLRVIARRREALRRRRRPHRRLLLSVPGERAATAAACRLPRLRRRTRAYQQARRQARARRLAARQRRHARRADLRRGASGEAVGEGRHQPVRHLAAGQSGRQSPASTRTPSSTPTRGSGCANGWVDYFTPQLYWPIAPGAQSYPVLLDWWVGENVKARHIWPGHIASRAAAGGTWGPDELNLQIKATRASGATGDIHFSMRTLMPVVGARRDSVLVGVATQPPRQVAAAVMTDKLRDELYASPSLIPASPWLGNALAGGSDSDVGCRPGIGRSGCSSHADDMGQGRVGHGACAGRRRWLAHVDHSWCAVTVDRVARRSAPRVASRSHCGG